MDDELFCPHCKTTKYRKPLLKFKVNVCGHTLCENCVELLFIKGSAPCTTCGLPLRKNNFRLRLFEDDIVEKELEVRRRVLKDFNKKEDDFASLREYDDYLEQVETIIYNLTYEVDVEQTKQMIEQYRRDNAELISKNRGKLDPDEAILDELIEKEREDERFRIQMHAQDEAAQLNKMRKLQKEQLVDELMQSDLPASQIIQSHQIEKQTLSEKQRLIAEHQQQQQRFQQSKQPTFFSTGIQLGRAGNIFVPVPKDESKPYVYSPIKLLTHGPKCPTLEEVESDGFLNHLRPLEPSERAGGFTAAYSCVRALQEAFGGLYFKLK